MKRRLDPCAVWKMDLDHVVHCHASSGRLPEAGSEVVLEAEGVHLTDDRGRARLDGIAGLHGVNIGHGRAEMARAISGQVLEMGSVGPFSHTASGPQAELARRLAGLAPEPLNRVLYSRGGSEANDLALQLVSRYFGRLGQPEKKKVISRAGACHGSTYATASLSGDGSSASDAGPSAGWVHHISAPNLFRIPAGHTEAEYCDHLVSEFEQLLEALGPESVAAFIAEPIMGMAGILLAPEGYHRRMQAVCRAHDILYIADEALVSFGRLGEMLTSEAIFGVVPDLLCLSGSLTSGYLPLGATLVSDAFYDVISSGPDADLFSPGFSSSGHPTACAAAISNLDILEEEEICSHVRRIGPLFQEEVARLERLDLVADVRGSHFLAGVELADHVDGGTGPELARRAVRQCSEYGLVTCSMGSVIALAPPLIVSREHCAMMPEILGRALEEVQSAFESEGPIPANIQA